METFQDGTKHYIDQGVQTDLGSPVPTKLAAAVSDLVYYSCDVSSEFDIIHSSSMVDHSRSSTRFHSAYSRASDAIEDSEDSVVSITTSSRALRQPQYLQKPSRPSVHAHGSHPSRVVSLPETKSAFSVKENSGGRRVVSMPLPGESSFYADDSQSTNLSNQSLLSGSDVQPRGRMHSLGSEIPHTPSLPSSPESVVIIANKDKLSEGFLRNNNLDCHPPTPPDDDGWVSWANSPPRPIPALHGPLSLPYARCPSGAEGTIIEEQDNLPRMIWGLEGEVGPVGRMRSELIPDSPSQHYRKGASQGKHHHTPGLQDTTPGAIKSAPSEAVRLLDSPLQRATVSDLAVHNVMSRPRYGVTGRALRYQESLELADDRRVESEGAPMSQLRDYDFTSALGSAVHGLRSFGLKDDLGLHWDSKLLCSERFKDSALVSSAPILSSESIGSFPSPVTSSVKSLISSRSPMNTVSLNQVSQFSHRNVPPRRLSALEIAQQYRQQQLQQQNLLPTPPNSSSPIWSSAFSPYQGSLLSPELLSVSNRPRLSPSFVQTSDMYMYPDAVRQFPKSPKNSISNMGTSSLHTLAPAIQIGDDLGDLTSSIYDVDTRSPLPKCVRSQYLAGSAVLRSANQIPQSSASLRPPPNTPLGLVSAARTMTDSAGNILPSSPLSQARLHGATQQYSRSVPLARLIQRRLSSVPEEDLNLASSGVLHPYNLSLENPSGQVVRDSQPHFLLSPPTPHSHGQRTPSAHSPLSSYHSGIVDDGMVSMMTHADANTERVTVRLPSAVSRNITDADALIALNNDSVNRHREAIREVSLHGHEETKGKSFRRGTRGRRGRASAARTTNGPERVDGGLVVKS
ncbi:uncharacterized protein FIBRA_03543 [Fibroporia radiculosa]|uniref:Uncharacterized protein n=1 Tax=Fibroporia radiculosa TaxID=599839 RepID=J4H2G6_9APHY|nr:uncharacterized protein FIBRA_03543 [Fibroporia radiculosa]CCM01489.1 predicted protein [Fibroporia radiculosa]